jgi:hypothetical protein
MVDREVGEALGRAALSMQETVDAMSGRDGTSRMPVEEARQTVEALNRLALALLENGEQVGQSRSGTGLQEAMEQLAELAQRQSSLSGQSNSLLPMDLGDRAMSEQMRQMAQEQSAIAKKLGGMSDMRGGSDDLLGEIDALAQEAALLAQDLSGGRMTQELLARQERLFHRLLDAGRTMEREEVSTKRIAERPGKVGVSSASELDAALLEGGLRYPVPGPEVLRNLPPAYRRLVIDYFDRLNRVGEHAPATGSAAGKRER